LHFKASEKRPQRNPAFISVSKSIVFLVFGCFFWVNEQRSLTLAIFSVSLRKSAHSPSGTEGERLPAMGGCKEGGKKDSEGKKNFWGFCFSAAGGYQSFNLWFFLSFLLLLLLLLTSFW